MQITLANLAQATEQQVFNQVARHLIKQKVRAVNEAGHCKYRPGNGSMCAAGCLMTDEEYDVKFDIRGSWLAVTEAYPDQVPNKHAYFINMLQKMHDLPPNNWDLAGEGVEVNFPRRLELFAHKHNLQFNLEELSK